MGFARAAALTLALIALAAPARAQTIGATEVDLELVLAVDVSFSMDEDEQRLQRDGYAAAFRDAEVVRAIERGLLGRVAVTYVEWAGAGDQRVVVPWTLIEGAPGADRFADALAAAPLRRARWTSISDALRTSLALLETNPYKGARRVIDVSGDGPNNHGGPVLAAREAVLARGVVINGLPLLLKQPGWMDIPDLDRYYAACVVGGPGSFSLPVRAPAEFARAIRTKLVLEVSGDAPPAVILPVQAAPAPSCLVGEALWERRFGPRAN